MHKREQMTVEIAREIAREAEVRLSSLLAIGTAADARATTLCGIFGAGSVALCAGVLAYLAVEKPAPWLVESGAVTAFILFIAALMAGFAAAPRDFWIAGAQPHDLREWAWDSEGNRWRSEAEMLDATAQRLGKLIDLDRELLEAGSRRLRRSLWVALAAILLGLCTFVVGRHLA